MNLKSILQGLLESLYDIWNKKKAKDAKKDAILRRDDFQRDADDFLREHKDR